MSSHSKNMNNSNRKNLENQPEFSRVLRSRTKTKEQKEDFPLANDFLDQADDQNSGPKSIEKQRYCAVEFNSPLHSVLNGPYQKSNPSSESLNEQALQTQIRNSYEKDSSFEDKSSFRTTEDKQFSSSFEFEDVEKSSKRRKIKQLILVENVSKNYFDIHFENHFGNQIVEYSDFNEEEKRTQAHGEDNQSQHSFAKIQVERDNSETHYDKSGNNSSQKEKSLENLDITELKSIERRKIREKNLIEDAIKQTGDQNDILKQRIIQLQKKLQREAQQNVIQNQKCEKMTQFGIKLNTKRFDSSLKHFRKYSF